MVPPGSQEHRSAIVQQLGDAAGLFEVVRIDEMASDDADTLQFLESTGLIPGRWAEVVRRTPRGVHVIGARANAIVPHEIAQHTWVRLVDPSRD